MSARLGFAAAAIALAAAMPSAASAATNLGAFWHLDESSASSAADSSGNNNHGIVDGPTSIAGRFGSSLNFDGIDDRVVVPRSESLEPETITVEAWVRASQSPGNFRYIVSNSATGCLFASYALYSASTGGIAFTMSGQVFDNDTVSPIAPAEAVWNGEWHHVVGTFDGAALRLYLDGVEVGGGTPRTNPITYGLDNTDTQFGMFGGTCNLPYAGDLDEPRVWRRALSAQEIVASAAMGGDATTKFGQLVDSSQAITYTSQFEGRTITISTESSTGTEKIDNVRLIGLLPLTSRATCNNSSLFLLNSTCSISTSNGDRTARLTVRPLLGNPTVTLRVNMESGRSFTVTVDTD